MTPKEAAKEIGCSLSTIKSWIRSGKATAYTYILPGSDRWVYDISIQEVHRLKKLKQTVGFPRGKLRTGERGKKQ